MKVEEMNIYRKLLNIANEIKPISKDMEVGKGYNSYKAVSEAQVKDVVKPIEFKYGVYSYPLKTEIVNQEVITTESTYNGKTEEKTKFVVIAKIIYRFVNVDKPEEIVDQETFGYGIDALDKSAGKAMTYAIKYGLINAYKMISGEDPDQFHSNDNQITNEKPKKETKSLGNVTEEEAYEKARKDLLMKINDGLDKEENAPYKAQVFEEMAKRYGVNGFMLIKPKKGGKAFMNEVQELLEEIKSKQGDKQ